MEIHQRNAKDESPLLEVRGRIDGATSRQLHGALERLVEDGFHQIRLDLVAAHYLSSAGIRVLLQVHQQLRRIQGSLLIIAVSPEIQAVIEMAGLQTLLARTSPTNRPDEPAGETAETAHARLEWFPLDNTATMTASLTGGSPFSSAPQESERLRFPACTYGLGIGAFGSSYDDCRPRFGEFLAVNGAVASLPADGNLPDDFVSRGTLVPEIECLHGATMRGEFAEFLAFDRKATAHVPLTEILAEIGKRHGEGPVALVMVAESAGLIGAHLHRSPASAPTDDALQFPNIRDWLSFTSEPVHDRQLALMTGIVASNTIVDAGWTEFLPAWTSEGALRAHLHTATFPYRPLPRGPLPLERTIRELFETGGLTGLLHLLHDDRTFDGLGDSHWRRGGLWLSPVTLDSTST